MLESTLNEEDDCEDISDTEDETEISKEVESDTVEVAATSESIVIIKPMIDKLCEVINFPEGRNTGKELTNQNTKF